MWPCKPSTVDLPPCGGAGWTFAIWTRSRLQRDLLLTLSFSGKDGTDSEDPSYLRLSTADINHHPAIWQHSGAGCCKHIIRCAFSHKVEVPVRYGGVIRSGIDSCEKGCSSCWGEERDGRVGMRCEQINKVKAEFKTRLLSRRWRQMPGCEVFKLCSLLFSRH